MQVKLFLALILSIFIPLQWAETSPLDYEYASDEFSNHESDSDESDIKEFIVNRQTGGYRAEGKVNQKYGGSKGLRCSKSRPPICVDSEGNRVDSQGRPLAPETPTPSGVICDKSAFPKCYDSQGNPVKPSYQDRPLPAPKPPKSSRVVCDKSANRKCYDSQGRPVLPPKPPTQIKLLVYCTKSIPPKCWDSRGNPVPPPPKYVPF